MNMKPMTLLSTALFLLVVAGTPVVYAGTVEDCNQVRDPDRQLRGCTAYIRSRPEQPANLATAYLNRANIYARRAQYEKAFADYRRALELDSGNPLIAYNLGNAHLDAGQPALAAEAFTRAINLDAEFALAFFNRGIARKRLGDHGGADEDFRRTLELPEEITAAAERIRQAPARAVDAGRVTYRAPEGGEAAADFLSRLDQRDH